MRKKVTRGNKKRVLLLNYEFPPLGGGAATATENFLRQCAEKEEIEFEVVVSSAGKFKIEQFAENIRIHYLDIGKNSQVHDQSDKDLLKYSWKAFWYARKLNKEKSFDLIHAFFGIPCGFIAMFLGVPYIVSLRGSDVPFYSEKYKWLDRVFFWWVSRVVWSRARRVVANSKGLKELALQTAPKQEIKVVYNGVDVEKFKPTRKQSKELTIISTSRIIERKGIHYLLEAFYEFSQNKKNAQLILVGEGSVKAELEKRVEQEGLSDKVIFVGAVDRDKMSEYYNQADIFALPSLNEGMSNSLLEAMASGLAIIATDTGGTRELVDESNGLIIKKKSANDIREKLEFLSDNPEKLSQMKQESRIKAQKMSWQEMAEQYLEIYSKMS